VKLRAERVRYRSLRKLGWSQAEAYRTVGIGRATASRWDAQDGFSNSREAQQARARMERPPDSVGPPGLRTELDPDAALALPDDLLEDLQESEPWDIGVRSPRDLAEAFELPIPERAVGPTTPSLVGAVGDAPGGVWVQLDRPSPEPRPRPTPKDGSPAYSMGTRVHPVSGEAIPVGAQTPDPRFAPVGYARSPADRAQVLRSERRDRYYVTAAGSRPRRSW
jgi:hypothetical protein